METFEADMWHRFIAKRTPARWVVRGEAVTALLGPVQVPCQCGRTVQVPQAMRLFTTKRDARDYLDALLAKIDRT